MDRVLGSSIFELQSNRPVTGSIPSSRIMTLEEVFRPSVSPFLRASAAITAQSTSGVHNHNQATRAFTAGNRVVASTAITRFAHRSSSIYYIERTMVLFKSLGVAVGVLLLGLHAGTYERRGAEECEADNEGPLMLLQRLQSRCLVGEACTLLLLLL